MNFYNLTNMQKSIWLTEEFYKGTPISNIAGTNIIDEKVDFDLLSLAINLFIKSHDAFRLKFKIINGIPKQYVDEFSNVTFDLELVSDTSDIKKIETELSSTIFNLEDSFLFKFKLFKLPDSRGGFVICMHHLISDAWSSGIVISKIMEIYTNLCSGIQNSFDDIPSYIDTIRDNEDYMQSSKCEKDKMFWEDMFSSIPTVATIPSLQHKNSSSTYAKRKQFIIPKETMDLITAFCKSHKVSEFNFFMAILAIYIYGMTDIPEFVIGTPILNRLNFKEKNTAGMFINTIPFKVSISNTYTFANFVSTIANNFFKIYKHQKYPYQELLQSLRSKFGSIPNLYSVAMSYQNMRNNAKALSTPYTATWIFNNHIADDIDIHFFDINDTGNISIAYDYKVDKYSLEDIFNLHARFLNIINQVLENENILIQEIELVLPDEKHKILYEFNNTKMDFPSDKTIISLFEEQVNKVPNDTAVVFDGQRITYKELDEKSTALASFLILSGAQTDDIIGIMLPRSLELIISIIATLKIGAVYMLINDTLPDERIAYMIKNSNSKIIISKKELTQNHNISLFNAKILNFGLDSQVMELPNIDNAKHLSVIYTSGSTGNPKGVLTKISSMINLMYSYINYIHANDYDNFLSTCNISFDMFSVEILLPLILGKTLILASDEEQKDPIAIGHLIIENNVQYMLATPSKIELLFLNETSKKSLEGIKSLQIGGENPSQSFLRELVSLTNAEIYNAYGPTETTSCCSIKKIIDVDNVTIGKPLGNMQIYILNKSMQLCPIGVIGEICIAGEGISEGYINNPDLTNTVFVDNPYGDGLLYKSGDLAYLTADYEIKFVGRNDTQLKINGLRIELSEIDSVISSFGDIQKTVTVYKNKKLISYFMANSQIDMQKLKTFAKSKLPPYMVPSIFVKLEAFPLSANGKLDVKKLPSIQDISCSRNIILPKNQTEQDLLSIFKSVLGENNISIDDDFFELGGDSLGAIKVSVEIFNKFNINIPVKDIFENSSIENLAKIINNSEKENKIGLTKVDVQDSYPLSAAQKRIYLSCSFSSKDSVLYNIPGGILFDKIPDFDKLEKCLQTLIDRHESLRTSFVIENDTIVQKINDNIKFKININNTEISEDEFESVFKSFLKPFDLSKAPLLRAEAFKVKGGKSLLLVDIHHIVADGTSSQILIDELCKLYNGNKLDDIKFTYKDFANFERNKIDSGEFKEAEVFWVNQFESDIPVLNMPTVYNRPAVQSFTGHKYKLAFDKETSNKIIEFCKTYNVTPYMFLLSAYFVLLSKYSSQEDIIIGSPVVGRNSAELYNIFGMFVNTLPIRAQLSHQQSFKDFLMRIKEITLNDFKYQDYPLDELISKLNIKRDTSRSPLFDTLFIFQNNGMAELSFNGIKSQYFIPDANISKADLSLEIVPENDAFNFSFEYSDKLFSNNYIKDLAMHYVNIVQAVLNNALLPISSIEMLSLEEKNALIYKVNDTQFNLPKNTSITTLFEKQVEETPYNIALVFKDKSLTYKELNEKANSLAHYIRSLGIKRNDIVGIMVNRSLEMIISMLAVLKSGAAYIPIDPDYPQDRIEYMLSNSTAKILLTTTKFMDSTNSYGIRKINLEDNNIFNFPTSNLDFINSPDDLAYVIYTSGSTGKPKGVMIKHEALVNFAIYLDNNIEFLYKTDEQHIAVSVTTFCFDIFILESFVFLQRGFKIYICTEEEQHIPSLLLNLIEKSKADVIQITPSRMKIFIENTNTLSTLKYIVSAGEALPNSLLHQLVSLGNPIVYNAYGPTETTVFSTFTDVTTYDNVTVGKPMYNTQTYILDKNLYPCPVNVPGELYIGGIGVAKGYFANQELTDKAFIPNPFIPNTIMYKTGDICRWLDNGEIEHLGRADGQIKIRGLRIELGEIEEKMLLFPGITKACAIKQTLNERDFISAYYTCNKKISITALRKHLGNYLPKYMIPSYFTVLEDFPYTPNGKIDRKVLPIPNEILNNNSNERNYIEPKTDLEFKMVTIWEKVLNTSPIGITDDFFELGGDSILAMNLNIELLKLTDKISYADIFKFPTISKLVEKMSSTDTDYNITYVKDNFVKYENVLNNTMKMPSSFEKIENPNILLTGATGFLGIHILDSFIKEETGNIYCIVRPETGMTAQAKLHQKLNYYFGNKYNDLIGKRIFAVNGYIDKPGFGLSQEELLELASNTNIVINSAARVQHYGIYQDFYNTNVKSVQYIVDFCKSFDKKLYHISTLSISGNAFDTSAAKQTIDKQIDFYESNLYINQILDNVYINTKFQAECLVLDAILEGLDGYILRMGNLMPRFSDGLFQDNILENAYINRILAFIRLGGFPEYIKDRLFRIYSC